MDRPDCLSLSYSAARLFYEDSKQMRSLHLLPHHALGKKTKPTSSAQMVTWIFLALIPKAPPQILLLVIIRMNPSQDPGQEVPRALSGAHSTMESTGELQHCMVPMHAASASFHAWESALPGIVPLPVRSFPAPRPPHAAAHGKDPSGGWLGFNVPKSSQSLPPYCLPHWHFFFKYMFGKQLKTVISSTPSRTI